jgi:hypothetical protein
MISAITASCGSAGYVASCTYSGETPSLTFLTPFIPSQPSSRRFYPTRLATTLTSSSPPLPTSTGPSSGPKEGFIVLETNYRIYAYTGAYLRAALVRSLSTLTN